MIKKPDTKKKTKAEKETQNLKSFKGAKTSVCKASPLSPSSSISSFQSGSGREDGQREEKTTPIDDFFSNHQQAKNYYYDTLSPTRARDGDARDGDARASSDVDLRVRGGDSSLFKDFPAYADLYSDFESELSSLSGRGENQGTSYWTEQKVNSPLDFLFLNSIHPLHRFLASSLHRFLASSLPHISTSIYRPRLFDFHSTSILCDKSHLIVSSSHRLLKLPFFESFSLFLSLSLSFLLILKQKMVFEAFVYLIKLLLIFFL